MGVAFLKICVIRIISGSFNSLFVSGNPRYLREIDLNLLKRS